MVPKKENRFLRATTVCTDIDFPLHVNVLSQGYICCKRDLAVKHVQLLVGFGWALQYSHKLGESRCSGTGPASNAGPVIGMIPTVMNPFGVNLPRVVGSGTVRERCGSPKDRM